MVAAGQSIVKFLHPPGEAIDLLLGEAVEEDGIGGEEAPEVADDRVVVDGGGVDVLVEVAIEKFRQGSLGVAVVVDIDNGHL